MACSRVSAALVGVCSGFLGGRVGVVSASVAATEMVQNLGPVSAYEPILKTVGNKHVIAYFVPGNRKCNDQTVIWNAGDDEAKSAGIKISLNPGQTASIDSSATESFNLRCGDDAETLAAMDQQFASN